MISRNMYKRRLKMFKVEMYNVVFSSIILTMNTRVILSLSCRHSILKITFTKITFVLSKICFALLRRTLHAITVGLHSAWSLSVGVAFCLGLEY